MDRRVGVPPDFHGDDRNTIGYLGFLALGATFQRCMIVVVDDLHWY